MRFPRRMLAVAAMLVATLMAFSEAPEILTLSDKVSNDCEAVQVARTGRRSCLVEDSTHAVNPAIVQLGPPAHHGDACTLNCPLSPPFRGSASLLLLLVTQRK